MPDVVNSGTRIHFEVVGAGPALVLQHGFSTGKDHWHDAGYVRELRDAYRLVLIDARGHGQSDSSHDPAVYSYQAMASDVIAVLDVLGELRAHFWGYSMGGFIAQCLGRDHSDRMRSLIIGGSGLPTQPPPEVDPFIPELEPGMEAYVAGREAIRGQRFPESTRRLFLQNDAQALIANRRGTQNETPCVPSSKIPCLIYAAAGDLPLAERLLNEVPGATFLPLPTLNHWTAFTQIDMILPHVKSFLRQVEAGGLAVPMEDR